VFAEMNRWLGRFSLVRCCSRRTGNGFWRCVNALLIFVSSAFTVGLWIKVDSRRERIAFADTIKSASAAVGSSIANRKTSNSVNFWRANASQDLIVGSKAISCSKSMGTCSSEQACCSQIIYDQRSFLKKEVILKHFGHSSFAA
jgi:hypothetical protein